MIEVAQKKRRCHRDNSHEIPKDTQCLVVVEQRGNKRNYCALCAKPILDLAAKHLDELNRGLRIGTSALTTSRVDASLPDALDARAPASNGTGNVPHRRVTEQC